MTSSLNAGPQSSLDMQFRRPSRPDGNIWGMAFTEVWERFSFYGLQGILSFYLLFSPERGGLELDAAAAAGIVGAYGGAVYVSQLLGAWVGERIISPKMMVLYGGIIIAAGHVVLAVWMGLTGLSVGLILIIVGTGALKTNITSVVGMVLEGHNDAKRDAGFTYFLMAINIGAVAGPFSTGLAQAELGFHWGFGLAAVGMFFALVQYMFSMRKLPEKAGQISNPLDGRGKVKALSVAIIAIAVIVATASLGLLPAYSLASIVTVIAILAAVWYFSMILTSKHVNREEKSRVASFIPIFIAIGLFFGLLFQQFTSIAVLVSERVDLVVFGWSFPVAWITMVSQLAAVLVTPFFARLWERLGTRQPGPATKVGLGMIQIGVAYAAMIAISAASTVAMIPLLLILLVMVVAGTSEILVNPIGMALATKIGPERFKSQVVGLYFLTLALGSSISGLFGQLFAALSEVNYFIIVAATGLVLGVLLIAFKRPLERGLATGLNN